VVCPGEALLFLILREVSSISCYKDVINQSCPFCIPRWLQDRMAQQMTWIQNGGWNATLLSCFQLIRWPKKGISDF
jgi:hypothetical protein